MNNWLDQFSVYSLLPQNNPAASPSVDAPMAVPMPMPPNSMDMMAGNIAGMVPTLPQQWFGTPQPPPDWHAPEKYTPPKPVGPVDIRTITELVRKGESSGNYQALNREAKGNTASGAYQYTDRTWNGYGGYSKAMLAPKHIQDKRFQEDLAARYAKYKGDPFKIIAEHYLPAAANNPAIWNKPYRLKSGQVVKPVADYVRHIVRGTDLEKAFNDYLTRQY